MEQVLGTSAGQHFNFWCFQCPFASFGPNGFEPAAGWAQAVTDVATTQAVDSANSSNITATQLGLNPTMGPEEAMAWLDIIQGYTAPRMAYALGLIETSSVAEAAAEDNGLWAYPNPASDQLQIELNAPGQQLALYSLDGRRVYNQSLQGATRIVLEVAGLSAGTYILSVDGMTQMVNITH